jgi:hypothetical protein
MTQLRLSCEEFYETIDRLERDDVYSEAVAKPHVKKLVI